MAKLAKSVVLICFFSFFSVSAVFAENSYTAWGTTVCAAGWTAAYTGYVTTQFAYTANSYDDTTNDYGWAWGAGTGSTFCSAASLAAGGTNSIFVQSSTNANSGRLSCAVCVK